MILSQIDILVSFNRIYSMYIRFKVRSIPHKPTICNPESKFASKLKMAKETYTVCVDKSFASVCLEPAISGCR